LKINSKITIPEERWCLWVGESWVSFVWWSASEKTGFWRVLCPPCCIPSLHFLLCTFPSLQQIFTGDAESSLRHRS